VTVKYELSWDSPGKGLTLLTNLIGGQGFAWILGGYGVE
jgi:hypothetical protein